MKRKSKSIRELRRPRPTKTERDKVLIVTEGEKTEPDYFNRLIATLGLTTAKVRVSGEGGAAPVSVFEAAEQILIRDDDFEQVYVVFDRDEHESYDEAIAKVHGLSQRNAFRKKTIKAITSVPCFEVWFRLHASNSCKPYTGNAGGQTAAKALVSDLRTAEIHGEKVFSNYDKKNCEAFFRQLALHRSEAKTRSARVLSQAKARGDAEHHENPSTRVHLVVEALEKLSKNS
ncbi:RloB family protein [Palleronia sp. LCG004]|uniref:RloB family protein n=1 Tax=Palleronia sp. LCG004 TaxID=3079304 RepID=UPI0029430E98|nr:RloB family protein [Palleronia sp. LCG004]WOI54937.1 RloB family protein [Palleronia sp. LCG004]